MHLYFAPKTYDRVLKKRERERERESEKEDTIIRADLFLLKAAQEYLVNVITNLGNSKTGFTRLK